MGLEDGEKYSEFVEIGQCADADRHRCADDFGSSLWQLLVSIRYRNLIVWGGKPKQESELRDTQLIGVNAC